MGAGQRDDNSQGLHSRVVFPPGRPCGGVVEFRSLAQTPVLLALGSETTGLAVLVHGVGDPVDTGVSADCLVGWAACQLRALDDKLIPLTRQG